jgi:large subunit ribosomal protein L33
VAKKKGDRIVIKMKSTESEYIYYSEKNKRNDTARLEIKKYDPLLRRHVVFRVASYLASPRNIKPGSQLTAGSFI